MTNQQRESNHSFEVPVRYINQSSRYSSESELPMLRMEYILDDYVNQDGQSKIIPISEYR